MGYSGPLHTRVTHRSRESRIKKLTSARNTSTRGSYATHVWAHMLYLRYSARRDVLRINKLTYARNSHARILKGVYEVNLLHTRKVTYTQPTHIGLWERREPRLALARQVTVQYQPNKHKPNGTKLDWPWPGSWVDNDHYFWFFLRLKHSIFVHFLYQIRLLCASHPVHSTLLLRISHGMLRGLPERWNPIV